MKIYFFLKESICLATDQIPKQKHFGNYLKNRNIHKKEKNQYITAKSEK